MAAVENAAPEAEAPSHENGAKLTGTVKKWIAEKGFGFIAPADGSGDCFVHASSIEQEGVRELAEGEAVSFTLEKKDNGKLAAIEVKGPDGGKLLGEWTAEDEVHTGTVARWRGDKGFGFIKPTEGEKDIFAHINETGVALTEAAEVEYTFETGADGRFKALRQEAQTPSSGSLWSTWCTPSHSTLSSRSSPGWGRS